MTLRAIQSNFKATANGGLMMSSDAAYANARSGSNLSVNTTVNGDWIAGQDNSGGIYRVRQYAHEFDTRGIGTIVSVDELAFYMNAVRDLTQAFTIEVYAFDWGSLGTADFISGSNLGTYPILASKAAGSWVNNEKVSFDLANGGTDLANYINKNGYTRVVTASSKQRTGEAPGVGSGGYHEFNTDNTPDPALHPYIKLTYRLVSSGNLEDIPGMLWWLRADAYADGVTINNTVHDVGGQTAQRNFTEVSALVTEEASTGIRYFNFNGGRYIRRSDAAALPAAGHTLIMVVKPVVNGAAAQIFFDTDVDNALSRTIIQQLTTNQIGFYKDGGGGNIVGAVGDTTIGEWMVITALNNGNGIAGSQLRLNGKTIGTATLTGTASGTRHTYGHRMDNSAAGSMSPMSHMLAWNRPLTESEMFRAERWLMARHGIDAWRKRLVVPG